MISTLKELNTLKLIFVPYGIERFISKYKLSFQKSIQDIETNEIILDIPKELFKYKRDKIILSIELYEDNSINQISQTYKFNVYKGENKVYVIIDTWNNYVFEILFKNLENITISKGLQNYTQFDSLDNKYRKRLTLINFNESNILINNKLYSMNDIINTNYKINDNLPKSFQISVEDLSEKIFIIKQLSDLKELDLSYIKDNKKILQNMMDELENLIIDKQKYSQKYAKFRKNYVKKTNQQVPNLNKENDYLNELYNNYNMDLDLFYNYFFNNFFINKNENFEFELIKNLVSYLKKIKNVLKKNNNINLDEKIRILSSYFHILSDCKKKEDLNIPIRHFIFSERKKNSILDKVYQFYNNFIEELTEEDEIFFYLLQIDSGYGFYKKNKVYTFDLTNIQMVKNHLKELFPKSLTFYKSNNGGIAFTSSITEAISINENFILYDKNNDIDYNSDSLILTNNEINDIAMNIILLLFHEFMGHKKFSLSQNPGTSPKKIIKNKKLIELKHKNENKKNEQNCEYILTTHSNKNKGDSGHFIELCYGKFNNELILNSLLDLKNKGKIIERIDLFTKSKETLSKYVALRVISEEKGYEFKFDEKETIEQEISIMEQKINIEEYIKEKEQKKDIDDKNNNKLINKKRKRTQSVKKLKYSENNFIKSVSEYESLSGEEGENSEVSDEKSDEKKLSKIELQIKRDKKIFKRLGLKNDDNLVENIINKFNEKNLSDQDFDDLNYLYSKFLVIY